MTTTGDPFWRRCSAVYDQRAEEYDGWFEESLLFDIERHALAGLATPLAPPKFEIGVGPGRFAAALGVHLGLDPARAPLHLAAQRGISVCQGIGEELPLATNRLGTLLLLFTLCFTEEPQLVLAECHRCLRPGGHLVLGIIPAASPWGAALAAKGEAGNPYYRHARFRDPQTVTHWLKEGGFVIRELRSTLRQSPQKLTDFETSQPGICPEAGFTVIVAAKEE